MGSYVTTILLAIFCGDIPWNFRPKKSALYGRYLQSIGSCCMAIDLIQKVWTTWHESKGHVWISVKELCHDFYLATPTFVIWWEGKDYPLEIKHGNGKSPVNGFCMREHHLFPWYIFQQAMFDYGRVYQIKRTAKQQVGCRGIICQGYMAYEPCTSPGVHIHTRIRTIVKQWYLGFSQSSIIADN